MNIKDSEIAEYFDISPRTLGDWKKIREKRYTALKWAYMNVKHNRQLCEAKEALAKMENDNPQ